MSQLIGNIVVIEAESDTKCELCGKIDETRPYGPNGEEICYECGMKDAAQTVKRMGIVLFGDIDAGN